MRIELQKEKVRKREREKESWGIEERSEIVVRERVIEVEYLAGLHHSPPLLCSCCWWYSYNGRRSVRPASAILFLVLVSVFEVLLERNLQVRDVFPP